MASHRPVIASRMVRSGKLYWAVLAFLSGFSILLIVISQSYLLPAFEAARHATPIEKKQLAAVSALLLAVVLFITTVGLLLVFRYGKRLFPHRRGRTETKTEYVDAWTESGRRMQLDRSVDGEGGEAP